MALRNHSRTPSMQGLWLCFASLFSPKHLETKHADTPPRPAASRWAPRPVLHCKNCWIIISDVPLLRVAGATPVSGAYAGNASAAARSRQSEFDRPGQGCVCAFEARTWRGAWDESAALRSAPTPPAQCEISHVRIVRRLSAGGGGFVSVSRFALRHRGTCPINELGRRWEVASRYISCIYVLSRRLWN